MDRADMLGTEPVLERGRALRIGGNAVDGSAARDRAGFIAGASEAPRIDIERNFLTASSA